MLYVAITLIGLGLLAIAIGIVTRLKASKILSAPVGKTGELARQPSANGLVSVEGAARAHQPIAAPCSNQPCVYFHVKVEKKVKETRGNQTTTSWKTAGEQHGGQAFYVDDGSGAVTINTGEGLSADLTKSYTGAPPAHLVPQEHPQPNQQVLEYRAIEQIIPADSRVFVMGKLANGQISKPDGALAKLTVSTRGRAALVGSTQRLAMILLAAGGVMAAGGVPLLIFKPGQVALCAGLKDTNTPKECRIETKVVEKERKQSDGSMKKETFQEHILEWEVTKPGKYALEVRDNAQGKKKSFPVIQVENSIGFPVNIGINAGFSTDSKSMFKTKTAKLEPGKYKVYLWGMKDGANEFFLTIKEAATETASR